MIKILPVYAGDRCKKRRFDPWVRKIPWRRKWQPTPVFLPRKSQGQRSLVGYSPYSHKESHMTERLNTHTHTHTTPSSDSTWSSPKFPQLRTVHGIYYPVPRDSICGLKSPLEKCGPEWVEHRPQGPLSSCTGLNRVQSYLGLPC